MGNTERGRRRDLQVHDGPLAGLPEVVTLARVQDERAAFSRDHFFPTGRTVS